MLSKQSFFLLAVIFGGLFILSRGQDICPHVYGPRIPIHCASPISWTVCPDLDAFIGPWYVAFWAAPANVNIYANGTQCVQIFGKMLPNETLNLQGRQILSGNEIGPDVNKNITKTITRRGCCTYHIFLDGNQYPAGLLSFDQYNHAIFSVGFNGSYYILIYSRDPRIQFDKKNYCLFHRFIFENDNNPGYIINPDNCLAY